MVAGDVFSRLGRPGDGPILLGGDPERELAALGRRPEGAAFLGRAVREAEPKIAELYAREIAAGVDVVCALTGETSARALAEAGMGFRAAALTGRALDLARGAAAMAERPVVVAGILGASGIDLVKAAWIAEECAEHAERLAAGGAELVLARGFDPPSASPKAAAAGETPLSVAVASAVFVGLPAWAWIPLRPTGETPWGELGWRAGEAARRAGARAVLYELTYGDEAEGEGAEQAALSLATAAAGSALGFLVPDPSSARRASAEPAPGWLERALRLADAGARVLGGGRGTTWRHAAALADALGGSRA